MAEARTDTQLAERMTLGCILSHLAEELSPDAHSHERVLREVQATGLTAQEFSGERERWTFQAITTLLKHGHLVTPENVWRVLRSGPLQVTLSWLIDISDVSTTIGAGWWAEQVKAQAVQRRLTAAGFAVAEAGQQGNVDPAKAARLIESAGGVVRRGFTGSIGLPPQ